MGYKVDKQVLISFSAEQKITHLVRQNWPSGSKFFKLVALPEGIFSFFLVPHIMLDNAAGEVIGEEFTFIIAGPDIQVEDTDEPLDVVTVYTEVSEAELKEMKLPADYQMVSIFPFFLRKEKKSSLIAL